MYSTINYVCSKVQLTIKIKWGMFVASSFSLTKYKLMCSKDSVLCYACESSVTLLSGNCHLGVSITVKVVSDTGGANEELVCTTESISEELICTTESISIIESL